jgi:hypothetical protein
MSALRLCERLMIGSGSDSYDPICDLPDRHDGGCRSTAAKDQNWLHLRCDTCGRESQNITRFRWIGAPRGIRGRSLFLVCVNEAKCLKRAAKRKALA